MNIKKMLFPVMAIAISVNLVGCMQKKEKDVLEEMAVATPVEQKTDNTLEDLLPKHKIDRNNMDLTAANFMNIYFEDTNTETYSYSSKTYFLYEEESGSESSRTLQKFNNLHQIDLNRDRFGNVEIKHFMSSRTKGREETDDIKYYLVRNAFKAREAITVTDAGVTQVEVMNGNGLRFDNLLSISDLHMDPYLEALRVVNGESQEHFILKDSFELFGDRKCYEVTLQASDRFPMTQFLKFILYLDQSIQLDPPKISYYFDAETKNFVGHSVDYTEQLKSLSEEYQYGFIPYEAVVLTTYQTPKDVKTAPGSGVHLYQWPQLTDENKYQNKHNELMQVNANDLHFCISDAFGFSYVFKNNHCLGLMAPLSDDMSLYHNFIYQDTRDKTNFSTQKVHEEDDGNRIYKKFKLDCDGKELYCGILAQKDEPGFGVFFIASRDSDIDVMINNSNFSVSRRSHNDTEKSVDLLTQIDNDIQSQEELNSDIHWDDKDDSWNDMTDEEKEIIAGAWEDIENGDISHDGQD